MEMTTFKYHLEAASKQAVELAKSYCHNRFSDDYNYIITPNNRNADAHLTAQEVVALEVWNKHQHTLLSLEKAIDLLHYDNKVPVWINISVCEAQSELTLIELQCSRRLREEKELMHPGFPPFQVQVAIPPDNLRNEKNGKFDVNWKKSSVNKRIISDEIDTKLLHLANRLNARITTDRPGYPELLRTFEERRIDWLDDNIRKAIILQPTFTVQGVDSSNWNLNLIAWFDDEHSEKRPKWSEQLVNKKPFQIIGQDIDNLLRIAEETLSKITFQDLG